MNWELKSLDEICLLITDGAHWSPKDIGQGYPMPSVKDMTENGFDFSNSKRISKEDFEKLKKSNCCPINGDVLIAKDGSYLKHCFEFKGDENVAVLSSIAIFRPNNEVVLSKFLEYLFRTPIIKGLAKGYVSGVAVPRIVLKDFKTIELPIPPLQTQKRIANILSAYDDLIENNLKRIKLLEQAAQNIYKEWFVNMRFPGYEKTPVNEETGLPEGWLKDFIGNQLSSVKRKGKLKKDEYLNKGLYPIIDQSNGYIGGYSDDELVVQDFPLPIVVFGDHTRRVKFINFPFISGADGTQLLYPKNTNLLPAYFYLAIKYIDLSDYAYARHFKYLKQQEIIIPNDSILKEFNFIVYPMLNQSIHLLRYNTKLKAARDILLPRLMNRTIKV